MEKETKTASPATDPMTDLQHIMYSLPQSEGEKVDAVLKDDTLWMTQKAMSRLFDVEVPAISKHLKNIFDIGELSPDTTVSKMETVVQRGFRGAISENIEFYNLDAIIAVGYRVNSARATRFRIWATGILKEYLTKGFVLDDERLKEGNRIFSKDYFRELLERIRSIRASERRIWQQVTDIFAECSYDYDSTAKVTKEFYSMVQNKFHYAITGKTAPEIVYDSADRTKEHMGLSTWKKAPDGRILKSDVKIAKNYLDEKQIKQLERTVTGYFDYIEDLTERGRAFSMQEFAESIDRFLEFREFKILNGKGRVSRERADAKAEAEYDEFNKTQKIVSDFDKRIREQLGKS